jgi:hypothetical protein
MGPIRGGGVPSVVGGDTMSTVCSDTVVGSGGDFLHAGDVGHRVRHPRRQWQLPAVAPCAQLSIDNDRCFGEGGQRSLDASDDGSRERVTAWRQAWR